MTFSDSPPPRRTGLHPLVWVAIAVALLPLVVAVGIPIVVAIGGRGDAESEAPPVNMPAPAQQLKLGKTFHEDGRDTTVLQVRKLHAPLDRQPVVAAQVWLGVRVKACTPRGSKSKLPAPTWSALDEHGYITVGRAEGWDDFPAQPLPEKAPKPGTCHVGWLLIGVPERAVVNKVGLGSPPVAEWIVRSTKG